LLSLENGGGVAKKKPLTWAYSPSRDSKAAASDIGQPAYLKCIVAHTRVKFLTFGTAAE
jgi:hypothetical protein